MIAQCMWNGNMWLFPFLMIIVMLIMFSIFFSRNGFTPPWWYNKNRYTKDSSTETPLDILKKRYAKGEITKEEFERMKNEIL
jgi:putative membrane protein